MADGFEAMVDAAVPFFTELAQNNTKDWFDPRKAAFNADVQTPAKLMGDLLCEDISRLTGRTVKFKLFRIYRDVRFSKDKTPLNAHLHMSWIDSSGDALAPTWFYGLAPDYHIIGLGIMGLSGPDLARFRVGIDARGDALQAAMDKAGVSVSSWGPEPLKRVPKPYPADHPHEELLRRKALAVTLNIPETWRKTGLISAVQGCVGQMLPIAKQMVGKT